MGYIESPVHAISRVHFHHIKRNSPVRDVEAVARCHPYGHLFFLGKDGRIYTGANIGRPVCLGGDTDEYVAVLVDLGKVTKEERKAHKICWAAWKTYERAREEPDRFRRIAFALGIKLSKAVDRMLRSHTAAASKGYNAAKAAAEKLNQERALREKSAAA